MCCSQFPLCHAQGMFCHRWMILGYVKCLSVCVCLQAIPFLMLEEVRRKDWKESFAHHVVTLGLMYYR